MWCFFDESYQDANGGITAIAACLMHDKTVRGLDLLLYDARKKHFGIEHARDLTKELKGNRLLSKTAFSQMAKYGNNDNISLAEHIFEKCVEFRNEHPIWIFGAVVYGTFGIFSRLETNRLTRPMADILDKVSACARRENPRSRVNLVFDSQICGDEPHIAAAVRRFVSGVGLRNVSRYPLVGVSHVTPGIQLADIGGFEKLRKLEWASDVNGYPRRGIQWWTVNAQKKLTPCHAWQ